MTIANEMPDTWVRALADAIEAGGHEVHDGHESAVVITLAPTARAVLDAGGDEAYLVVGWSERAGTDWGLSADGAHVPNPQLLGGNTPADIAARVHRLLTTGRPEPRTLRHAIPYAASRECRCETVHPCGGIVPDPDCPDHGARRNPAMEWHWEANCAQVSAR